ncbi:hypothetical protein [Austwickia chelonae]|nr:hypothetical protein [Austwickia chelonae]
MIATIHLVVHPLPTWLLAIFGAAMAVSVGLTFVNAWHRHSERLAVEAR